MKRSSDYACAKRIHGDVGCTLLLRAGPRHLGSAFTRHVSPLGMRRLDSWKTHNSARWSGPLLFLDCHWAPIHGGTRMLRPWWRAASNNPAPLSRTGNTSAACRRTKRERVAVAGASLFYWSSSTYAYGWWHCLNQGSDLSVSRLLALRSSRRCRQWYLGVSVFDLRALIQDVATCYNHKEGERG